MPERPGRLFHIDINFRPASLDRMKRFPVIVVGLLSVVSVPRSQAQEWKKAEFNRRVAVEAIRKRIDRIAGGDFDDKLDRVTFTVRLKNNGIQDSFDNHSAEFYIFAKSILDRNAFKLLGVTKTDFSLPVRKTHEFVTEEAVTRYDKTGARFGAAYDSWAIIIRDSEGKLVKAKASSTQWEAHADELKNLKEGKYCNRDLKEVEVIR